VRAGLAVLTAPSRRNHRYTLLQVYLITKAGFDLNVVIVESRYFDQVIENITIRAN